MPWNPDQYNKFKAERYAPFTDLLSLIKKRDKLTVIDLGCGTGELTHQLALNLPGSYVKGIDSSEEMLYKVAEFAGSNIDFQKQSIENVISEGTKWDVVFSHAALQWIDDHENLIPHIIALVNKGGQLAIQMPANHDHFTHTTIKAIAETEPFKTALNGWTRKSPVLDIESYARLLFENGGKNITVFAKVYVHILDNANALAEWTSGTALIPYLERLPEDLREEFMSIYRQQLNKKYSGGSVFYPFKRILMAATF